jgi:hypothetical protein
MNNQCPFSETLVLENEAFTHVTDRKDLSETVEKMEKGLPACPQS